jgi:hypothetical protein
MAQVLETIGTYFVGLHLGQRVDSAALCVGGGGALVDFSFGGE